MNQSSTKLSVQRGGPGEELFYEEFTVPYQIGMSVLDALIWIRANVDSSLAIRYSCTNANTCKECMLKVDGEIVYSCTKRLNIGAAKVGPLTNKKLLRDLVTDIAPPKEKLSSLLAS